MELTATISIAVLCVLVALGLLAWVFAPEEFTLDLCTDEEMQESIASRQAQPAEPPAIVSKMPQPTNWIETLLRRGA